MISFAVAINHIMNLLFKPLNAIPEDWGLMLVSALVGIIMLVIFKFTSNQQKIKTAKDRIKAHILEIRLYNESPRVIMRALKRILQYNATYLRHAVVPIAFVIIPVVLILINLNFRYGYQAFKPGDAFVVKAVLQKDADLEQVKLIVPPGVRVDTPALHIPALSQVNWRLRIEKEGIYDLVFSYGATRVEKKLVAAQRAGMISPQKPPASFFSVLANPAENPLPASPFTTIEVLYSKRQNEFFGLHIHWLVTFFILSLIFAFALKKPLGVEI